MVSGRRILTYTPAGRREVQDIIQGIFVAELLRPSGELWIVSPWISDISVINDATGRFKFLHDSGLTRVRLSTALGSVTKLGGRVSIVTRPTDNEPMIAKLRAIQETAGEAFRIVLRESLHAKGIAGDGYAITGSMNLTWSGTAKWDEFVELRTGTAAADVRSRFREAYATSP